MGLSADFSGQAPAVFSTVNTVSGEQFVTARASDVTANGFGIAMAEFEANTDGHRAEDIAFLAISTGTFDGLTIANQLLDSNRSFSDLDVDLAHISQANGLDPAVVRRDADTFELFVQEDTSLNAETNHMNDQVSLLDLEQETGFFFG